MGVFDKIKNALFEEEYVEVEEKPKVKAKREKPKKEVKVNKESKPIAKKIVLPDKQDKVKEVHIDNRNDAESIDHDFDVEPLETRQENSEFKFPMMDDRDFKVEEDPYIQRPKSEPEIVRVIESDYKRNEMPVDHLYQGKKEKNLYGIDDDNKINVHEYGTYEKKEEKKNFKPSPIISPIYGVLDKNYKKEEIVTKKEVRLTSSYARENLSVDDVRNKAYGTLSDDIAREIQEEPNHLEEDASVYEDDSNLLVDLSSDTKKPQVHEVTMGDAEEYFQDLGLEYNIDYKDLSKEKATGRRSKEHYDDLENEEIKVEKEENKEIPVNDNDTTIDIDADDNLFDLIDSMYEEEK